MSQVCRGTGMIEMDASLLRALRCFSHSLFKFSPSLAETILGERIHPCAADCLFVSFSLSLFVFLLFPGHQGDFQ